MSLVRISEIADGRDANVNVKGVRERTRVFRVRTSSHSDDALLLFLAADLVALRDPHPLDSGCLCNDIAASEDQGSPWLWLVTCEYSSEQEQEGKEAENPLERPPDISWDAAEYEEPYETDQRGRAVASSSHEPIDPPLQRDAGRGMWRIERNEAEFDEARWEAYRNVTNSDPWRGKAVGTCLMKPIRGRSQYENGVQFARVSYEIHYDPRGWTHRPLDRAFSYLDANGDRVPFRDPQGTPLQAPTLLNGRGRSLGLAVTILAANCSDAATSLAVDDRDTFGPPPFVVRIGEELIQVLGTTAGPPESLAPVVRGFGGTVAASHEIDDEVTQEPVALEFVPYASLPFAVFGF